MRNAVKAYTSHANVSLLDLDTSCREEVNVTLRPLYREEKYTVPTVRRLSKPQNRFG